MVQLGELMMILDAPTPISHCRCQLFGGLGMAGPRSGRGSDEALSRPTAGARSRPYSAPSLKSIY
jgi:hypothetical protein